jgi:hypothetical protein
MRMARQTWEPMVAPCRSDQSQATNVTLALHMIPNPIEGSFAVKEAMSCVHTEVRRGKEAVAQQRVSEISGLV